MISNREFYKELMELENTDFVTAVKKRALDKYNETESEKTLMFNMACVLGDIKWVLEYDIDKSTTAQTKTKKYQKLWVLQSKIANLYKLLHTHVTLSNVIENFQ